MQVRNFKVLLIAVPWYFIKNGLFNRFEDSYEVFDLLGAKKPISRKIFKAAATILFWSCNIEGMESHPATLNVIV